VEELEATAVGVVAGRMAVRRGGAASSTELGHGGSGASRVLRERAVEAGRKTEGEGVNENGRASR